MTSSSHSSSENPIVVRNRHFSLFPTLLSQIPRKGRRIGDGHVSESKSADSSESESLDELDALRAEQHYPPQQWELQLGLEKGWMKSQHSDLESGENGE